jgi:hypothetical protein
MNDQELNEVLKRATVPERGAEYWEQFPRRVTAEMERRRHDAGGTQTDNAWSWAAALRFLRANPSFALGLAAFCVLICLALGSWNWRPAPATDPSLAEVRKYFHELEALFPNQLQAIMFDQQGAHLVLANEPNLPVSPPLYLTVRGPKGCQRFVTFSGQQIRVNGDVCDVLADGRGGVLLVGRQVLWAGAQSSGTTGRYRIEARLLEATL